MHALKTTDYLVMKDQKRIINPKNIKKYAPFLKAHNVRDGGISIPEGIMFILCNVIFIIA